MKLYGPAIHEAWPIMPGVVYCNYTFDAFRVTLSSILRILAVNEAVLDKQTYFIETRNFFLIFTILQWPKLIDFKVEINKSSILILFSKTWG